jgi:hypothetical protein
MFGGPPLPLWRLISGIAVLGAFVAVLGFLTPVYIDDIRLHRYIVSLPAAPDETVRSEILARARQLDLPVKPGDIHIVRTGPKAKIELKYVVQMNLGVYPVDLHFPTIR